MLTLAFLAIAAVTTVCAFFLTPYYMAQFVEVRGAEAPKIGAEFAAFTRQRAALAMAAFVASCGIYMLTARHLIALVVLMVVLAGMLVLDHRQIWRIREDLVSRASRESKSVNGDPGQRGVSFRPPSL